MKLDQLLLFSEACKYKSISIASEKNFISQPSFSSSISKLEKELNVKLLKRTTKGVLPTKIGTQVLEKVATILDSINDIKDIANSQNLQGTIKISTIPCMCDKILPNVLKNLKQSNSPITLSISSEECDNIYNSVIRGESALGIVFENSNFTSNEIHYTNLFKDEFVLYVGQNSPYFNQYSITLEQALAEPYIAYKEEFLHNNGGLTDMFNGLTPNICLRLDELESMKKLISEENYVAFFPQKMSEDNFYLTSGLIKAVKISNFNTIVNIGYIESTKYKPSTIDKIFIDTLKKTVIKLFDELTKEEANN